MRVEAIERERTLLSVHSITCRGKHSMREMRDKLRPSEFRKIQVVPLSLLGARLLSRTTSTMDYRGEERRRGWAKERRRVQKNSTH